MSINKPVKKKSMGQIEKMMAQARAIKEEENEQRLIINHGNVAAFCDCLSCDLRDFFDARFELIEKSKKLLKLFRELENEIEKNEDPYYESSIEILEKIYQMVEEF